jgi:hypothetical protein
MEPFLLLAFTRLQCSSMRTVLAALVVCCLTIPLAMSASPADSVDVRLDAHRWTHRLLFVFAPSTTHDAFQAQMDALAEADAGLRDRDMRLFTVVAEGTSRQRMVASDPGQPLTGASVRRLRDRFDVPMDAVRIILVGKDGSEKRRESDPVSVRALFDQIDAMPMRQREMRRDSTERNDGT